jgi:hypothetical protein
MRTHFLRLGLVPVSLLIACGSAPTRSHESAEPRDADLHDSATRDGGTVDAIPDATNPVPIPDSSPRDASETDASPPVMVSGHPRLWLREADLPRLRAWANDRNPIYQAGLAAAAAQARRDMDAGHVPGEDNGGYAYSPYPTEMYAELFAFLSLVSPGASEREDYAERARTLLMHVMNRAVLGVAEGQPFRSAAFSVSDRSRWQGEAFALTVDWIYPHLSTQDKTTIRRVFLRWADENMHATVTGSNHPEPIGVVNDPVLLSDPERVRWAGNNYFSAHLRNLGLMALAFDEADDPDGALRAYLVNATGAWLYMADHLYRGDALGGLPPEGFQYGPQALAFVAQFLLALKTAGQDDPARHGRQVVLAGHPFWEAFVPAYLHSMSPRPSQHSWLGEVYRPAWYGDGLKYWAPDSIGVLGALGLYDELTGHTTRLAAIRWIQRHIAPGASAKLLTRASDPNSFLNCIFYFLLFDPNANSPSDPRPSLPLVHYSPGLGRILARTGWDPDASWFTYKLGWSGIDHMLADGNQFELYRHGEWLTKERTGYGNHVASSDYHNTLALENDRPIHDSPNDYRYINWQRGSQWLQVPSGDGKIVAHSVGDGFVYAMGDATQLYNSAYENSTDIVHASRSVVWLEPDHVVVYDRAASRTTGRYKRFWLNLPVAPTISGHRATARTATQQLVVSTVLPIDAGIRAEPAEALDGEPAEEDPMRFRLRVEAPGGPATATFLHVLQGADLGVVADAVSLVESTSGTPYQGVSVHNIAVLFPKAANAMSAGLSYAVPPSTTKHIITGLEPGARYQVSKTPSPDGTAITIRLAAGDHVADQGGVLVFD